MELVSIAAVATTITTIFFTKTLEKAGENLGELISDKAKLLADKLSSKSTKLKGLFGASEESPLQIEEAILEVKELAEQDPEIAKEIKEIESAAQKEPNSTFQSEIQRVQQEANNLIGQQPNIQNLTQLAEKIAVFNQGYIGTQNNEITI